MGRGETEIGNEEKKIRISFYIDFCNCFLQVIALWDKIAIIRSLKNYRNTFHQKVEDFTMLLPLKIA